MIFRCSDSIILLLWFTLFIVHSFQRTCWIDVSSMRLDHCISHKILMWTLIWNFVKMKNRRFRLFSIRWIIALGDLFFMTWYRFGLLSISKFLILKYFQWSFHYFGDDKKRFDRSARFGSKVDHVSCYQYTFFYGSWWIGCFMLTVSCHWRKCCITLINMFFLLQTDLIEE